jgi:hypothetical protein
MGSKFGLSLGWGGRYNQPGKQLAVPPWVWGSACCIWQLLPPPFTCAVPLHVSMFLSVAVVVMVIVRENVSGKKRGTECYLIWLHDVKESENEHTVVP